MTGVDGLTQLIVDYATLFPQLRIHPTAPVTLGPDHGQLRWAMSSRTAIHVLGHDFGRAMTGTDIITFAHDDRIQRVVGLIDGL